MTTLREAAQQALEALSFSCPAPDLMSKHEAAEAALRAALEQPEQATGKESLPVGQGAEGGWQSAPSPQVTQRIADMPMSEYRRGVNDGFKLGLREGRIKAEDEMREQPEQEPVAWIQSNHLQQAQREPFLCRVEPMQRLPDFVPLYTHPPRREWRGLTEEELCDLWSWSATSEAERTATTQQHAFARAIEKALKEKNDG